MKGPVGKQIGALVIITGRHDCLLKAARMFGHLMGGAHTGHTPPSGGVLAVKQTLANIQISVE